MKNKIGISILIISSFILVFFVMMKNNEGNYASADGTEEGAEYKERNAESELSAKIGMAINEKGYPIGGIKQEIISNKNVKLNLLFGDEVMDNEDSKQEVRGIVREVIKANNYDFNSFQIDFTRMLIDEDVG